MNRRLCIFSFIFITLNLAFIPLISLYGLRVCPVLSIPGFGFGCFYSGAYIALVNVFNFALIAYLNSDQQKTHRVFIWCRKNSLLSSILAYLVATLIALIILQTLLKMNHLSPQSRAPEILGIASLLLGILQTYGLNWALKNNSYEIEKPENETFKKLWFSHIFRMMLPIAITVAVILHFLISQSVSFNEGRTAPIGTNDSLIEQTSYVVVFLISWLLLTFSFHFLSESDQVIKVQTHFDHLNNLNFKIRTNLNQSWGLWTAFIHQLNSFSKILGERTQLLKSFSRFVTATVAEQALDHEIKETTGTMRELTVLMSDIRNFTSMSEQLSPHQVVSLLNEYFTAMLDVISGAKINVDKFIGDGILAYVNTEEDHVDPEIENRLGVEAALAMLNKLTELNIKLKKMDLPEVNIGIGIYRGPLVIGLIGSEAKLQHTIIGDTVNRTARLESLCKELGVSIVISGHVWHSLEQKHKNIFQSYGKQTVHGIAQPIEVFGGPIVNDRNTN